jgi:Tfp pilus assembly protein PilO
MKIKNRQQLLIIVTLAAVGLFAADRIVINPLSNLWSSRKKEIAKLQSDVSNARGLVKQESRLRSRWDEMRRNTLPDNQSVAQQQVLRAFDRWARESGVTITSINPQRHEGDDYSTLQCRVEGSGSLTKVTQFLYAMEKDPMALRFENIEISAHDTEGQVLGIGLQVSGLILPEQPQKK